MKITRKILRKYLAIISEAAASNVASAGSAISVNKAGLNAKTLEDIKSIMGAWGRGGGLANVRDSAAYYLADVSDGVGSDLSDLLNTIGAGSTGDIGEATIGHIAGAAEGYTSFMNLNMETPQASALDPGQLAGRGAGAFLGCDLYFSKGSDTDFRNIARKGNILDLSKSGDNIFVSAKASAMAARGIPSRQSVKFREADQLNIVSLILYHWLYSYLSKESTIDDEPTHKFAKKSQLGMLQTGYRDVETALSIYRKLDAADDTNPLEKLEVATTSKDYKNVQSVVANVLENIGIEQIKIRFDAYNLSGFAHGEGKDFVQGHYKKHKPLFIVEKKDIAASDTIIDVATENLRFISGETFSGQPYPIKVAVIALDQFFTKEQAQVSNLYLHTRLTDSWVSDGENKKRQKSDITPYQHDIPGDTEASKLQAQRFFVALNTGKAAAENLSDDFTKIREIFDSSPIVGVDHKLFFSNDPNNSTKLQQWVKFDTLVSAINDNSSINQSILVIEDFIKVFSEELSSLAGDDHGYGIKTGRPGRQETASLSQTVFSKETDKNTGTILLGDVDAFVFPTAAAQLKSIRTSIQNTRNESEKRLDLIKIVLPALDESKQVALHNRIVEASVKCFNILLVAELIVGKITHTDVDSVVGGLIMDNVNYKQAGYKNLDNAISYLKGLLTTMIAFLETSEETTNNVVNIADFQKAEPMGGEARSAAALNTNSNEPILQHAAESKLYESILRELLKNSK